MAVVTEPELSAQRLPISSSSIFQSCILYQNENENHHVTLIDIPRSIATAQGAEESPYHKTLLSCAPLELPFPSNEPKSDAAKARLKAKMGTPYDDLYIDCVSKALSVIHENYRGQYGWCLPRRFIAEPTSTGKKRKANEMQNAILEPPASSGKEEMEEPVENKDHPPHMETSDLLRHLATDNRSENGPHTLRWNDVSTSGSREYCAFDPWDHHLSNPAVRSRNLAVSTSNLQPTTFFVPAGAAFYLGDCTTSRPFHSAVRNQAQTENTTHRFDFVIMDPPWPNASVARARKTTKSSYDTAPSMWHLRQLLFEMDIDVLLADDALVAIWITNSSAARNLVLGEDGLFESWNVELEEEWLWIKTTRTGDPVVALDSSWRKPYEVLLLGRKRLVQRDNVGEERQLKRRVIAGTPDLHSRKPCLKELIEPLMPDSANYRALEIFARHLVAGWWSWGNEVIKFNHERCWRDDHEQTPLSAT